MKNLQLGDDAMQQLAESHSAIKWIIHLALIE
jgi:hypothetical protein